MKSEVLKRIVFLGIIIDFVSLAILSGCRPKQSENVESITTSDSSVKQTPTPIVRQDTLDKHMSPSGEEIFLMQSDTIERTDAFFKPKKKHVQFTAEQLYGEWIAGTRHECYFADSTGLQWDTQDDVSREEAQHFFWYLTGNNRLMQVYTLGVNGIVPRDYDVTFIDGESLIYKDAFGTPFIWNKMSAVNK